MATITINKKEKLFVIQDEKYTSCLGFDVLERRFTKLAEEIGYKPVSKTPGTLKRYNEYHSLLDFCRKKHEETGWRSQSELIPEFIGREGQRVEVVTSWGETFRYYIGKSTGFIPCHLEVKRKDSSGGGSVCGYPFKSIKFLSTHR